MIGLILRASGVAVTVGLIAIHTGMPPVVAFIITALLVLAVEGLVA